jgi:MATE family multidrug resistance protein
MSPNAHAWKRELSATFHLSLPLVLTNLAQMAMTTTDLIFIGRLGPQALAASTLGVNLYNAFALFALGLVTATAPMIARETGARPDALGEVRRTVHQGLWSAGFLGYLVLRSFVAALQRPRMALIAALVSIAFNALANWILIFGNLGFPAMGLFGAGLASALASLFLFLSMAVVVTVDRGFQRYRLFRQLWQPDWQRLRALWKLGVPIAIATAFEVTIFNAAAFLIGWMGAAELAAHAVALQLASISFMVPYGIAQAATVRVGHAYGAGRLADIGRAGWTAFALGIAFMAMSALGMILIPRVFIAAFLDLNDPANAQVISIAVSLLAVAALFQIVDGGQVLGAGMLRGLHDTRIPMLFAGVGYWCIGLPSGAALAFWAGWGAVGVWSGLAIGLSAVSVLVIQRWVRRSHLGLLDGAGRSHGT